MLRVQIKIYLDQRTHHCDTDNVTGRGKKCRRRWLLLIPQLSLGIFKRNYAHMNLLGVYAHTKLRSFLRLPWYLMKLCHFNRNNLTVLMHRNNRISPSVFDLSHSSYDWLLFHFSQSEPCSLLDSSLHVLCVLLYTVCMCRFVTWWGGPGGIEAYP